MSCFFYITNVFIKLNPRIDLILSKSQSRNQFKNSYFKIKSERIIALLL